MCFLYLSIAVCFSGRKKNKKLGFSQTVKSKFLIASAQIKLEQQGNLFDKTLSKP
jgi:hypothetical protein